MRAYADRRGLDDGEMLRRFTQASSLVAAKPDLAFPIPLGERSLPGSGVLLVALILAVCGYGGWFYPSTADGPPREPGANMPRTFVPYRGPSLNPPTPPPPPAGPRAPRP